MTISEPVRLGLVQSLARPGANVTGLTQLDAELSRKRLELLKTAVPELKSVVLVWGTEAVAGSVHAKESQIAAQKLGLDVRVVKVSQPDDLQSAFTAVTKIPGPSVFCLASSFSRIGRESLSLRRKPGSGGGVPERVCQK